MLTFFALARVEASIYSVVLQVIPLMLVNLARANSVAAQNFEHCDVFCDNSRQKYIRRQVACIGAAGGGLRLGGFSFISGQRRAGTSRG